VCIFFEPAVDNSEAISKMDVREGLNKAASRCSRRR
jgi:hypothetical protein